MRYPLRVISADYGAGECVMGGQQVSPSRLLLAPIDSLPPLHKDPFNRILVAQATCS